MSTQHPCTTNNILCQYSQQSIHNLNLSTFTCLISSTTDTQRILFFWEIHQINLVSTSLTIWPNSISKGLFQETNIYHETLKSWGISIYYSGQLSSYISTTNFSRCWCLSFWSKILFGQTPISCPAPSHWLWLTSFDSLFCNVIIYTLRQSLLLLNHHGVVM